MPGATNSNLPAKGAKDNLHHFKLNYAAVQEQLDALIEEVEQGWDGCHDPDVSRQEKLVQEICSLVEEEAKKKQLSEADMRGYIGALRGVFRQMMGLQKLKDAEKSVSYQNVGKKMKTIKPGKEKSN